jgi:hypothetical protein
MFKVLQKSLQVVRAHVLVTGCAACVSGVGRMRKSRIQAIKQQQRSSSNLLRSPVLAVQHVGDALNAAALAQLVRQRLDACASDACEVQTVVVQQRACSAIATKKLRSWHEQILNNCSTIFQQFAFADQLTQRGSKQTVHHTIRVSANGRREVRVNRAGQPKMQKLLRRRRLARGEVHGLRHAARGEDAHQLGDKGVVGVADGGQRRGQCLR